MEGRGRGRGKRPLEGPPDDGKARFERDEHGDLKVVKPGELLSSEKYEAEKTEEDLHYEAYLSGKAAGKIREIGGFSDGVDRAAVADSNYARESAAKEGEPSKYAPSRAYNNSLKFKHSKKSQADSGASRADGIRALDQAMRRAAEGSDDDEDGIDSLSMNAVQLANRAMEVYNTQISNLAQLDVHGNDLRLPLLERKLRKFAECFGEEISVKTVQGQPVLKDFDSFKKRYGTVFRESGAALRGEVRKRFYFERQDGNATETYCLDFELHSSLVTPRPGLALDGSMGCLPPREQELMVLYVASGGEITSMYISRDEKALGSDPAADQGQIEGSDAFGAFRQLIEKLSDGEALDTHFNAY